MGHRQSEGVSRHRDEHVVDDFVGDAAWGDHPAAGDEDFEMANLSAAQTGVPGVIFISTRFGRHGPRVKYYERPGSNQPSFVVTIAEEPAVVANSLPQGVLRRMSPLVIEWVRLNRAALLSFWNEGLAWMDEDVTAFKSALVRVS